jgi:hypothetical protein
MMQAKLVSITAEGIEDKRYQRYQEIFEMSKDA